MHFFNILWNVKRIAISSRRFEIMWNYVKLFAFRYLWDEINRDSSRWNLFIMIILDGICNSSVSHTLLSPKSSRKECFRSMSREHGSRRKIDTNK
jgi:hypothetical protein